MSALNIPEFQACGCKHPIPVGFVYMMQLDDVVKIGKARDTDDIIRSAKRWHSSAELVAGWPTLDPLKLEKQIHNALNAWRIHPKHEQFNLPDEVCGALAFTDDHGLMSWCDLGFDLIGLRVGLARFKRRGEVMPWRCVFFPNQHTCGWVGIMSQTRPEYENIEQMYQQNPQCFQLSRPVVVNDSNAACHIDRMNRSLRWYRERLGIDRLHWDYSI